MKKNVFAGTIFVLMLFISGVFLASCRQIAENDYKGPGGSNVKITDFESTQELKKFSSAKEIMEFLKKANSDAGYGTYYGGAGIRSFGLEVAEQAGTPLVKTTASADSAASDGASDYSQTNVQVAGVDEADFVKNDGKYIYTITQDKLVIVKAYPAEDAEIVSETKIDGRPRNMFLNKDRLAVFAEDNDETPVFAEYDFVPRPRYTTKTHIFVYDITDKSDPELVKDYNMNGYYFESRMIDDYVYFIVKGDVYYSSKAIDLPLIKEASTVLVRPEIFYFDNPDYNYNFNTIASFNIFGDEDKVNAKTFMMGYSNVLYVSQDNIYITYQKNLPYKYYEEHNKERFFKMVVPLLPSDAQSNIKQIDGDNSLNSYQKWEKISDIMEEMYNGMNEDDRDGMIEKIQGAIEDYEAQLEAERRKTVIHKISIDDGDIEYGSKGEVPGYLLNQFSMDEHEGYFRVATTMEFYGGGPIPLMGVASAPSVGVESITAKESTDTLGKAAPETAPSGNAVAEESAALNDAAMAKRLPPARESRYTMYNNVYVLNDKLEIVGKLEAIAPDERIYSTRFIGDRLYMVTFKRVDPLFVIDLSSPQSPKILGELKIPGYSDYLHPYDEDHIIGVGKETESNEWGGISTKGVKLALFDVSDVENPKLVDKYEIGDSGTDSEALRDHKAFLFDRNKNLLVIPVAEVKDKPYYDSRLGYYRQRYWQGAYVFGVTPEDGFNVKGKIAHNEGDEVKDYYYYDGSPNAIRRSLYMGDVLYTVSATKIKANDLDNIDDELKEINLPYEKVKYYDYPWY